MKHFISIILLVFISNAASALSDSLEIADEAYIQMIDSIDNSFNYQYGEVVLEEGLATITVPEGYKFLDAEQSQYVLTDLWGNPPSESMGMLFPENMSPLSDSLTFAVEVVYSEEGYIDDEDAKELDYEELLATMQEDTEAINPERIEQGYEAVELVGWASAPFYDDATKKLHWAKELKFGDAPINTLNYNIRILGREGYINMNAIGDVDVLPVFNQDIDRILASVEFTEGNRYEDFNPDVDKIAAYGIGGLIAGKTLAKVGFFAMLAKFWKVIALAVAGGFGLLRNVLFGSKKES